MGSAIVTRYQRYKAGTRQTVQYLFDLASKCRKASDTCRELFDKLSCFEKQANGKQTPRSQKPEPLMIKTRELENLARYIAAMEPPVTIDDHFWTILEDVIALREECSLWYASQAIHDKTELAASNRSHTFFLGTLKRIHEILSSLRSKDAASTRPTPSTPATQKAKRKKTKTKTETQLSAVENLFERLNVEEPLTMPLGGSPVPSSAPQLTGTSVTLEADTDSACMALWSYLSEMNDIRTYVRELWLQFRDGNISLANAGMITETALGMTTRAYKEFVEAYPQFATWKKIVEFLRLRQCINKNLMYCFSKDDGARVQQAAALEKPIDLLCTPADGLLGAFLMSWNRHAAVASKTGQIFHYEDLPAFERPRPQTALEPVLLGMVQEIYALETFADAYKAYPNSSNCEQMARHNTSEFTNALLQLRTEISALEGFPPMSAVVACQICIDIHEAVNCRADCGVETLLRITERARRTVDEALQDDHLREALPRFISAKEISRVVSGVVEHASAVKDRVRRAKLTAREVQDFSTSKCLFPGITSLPHRAGGITYLLQQYLHGFGASVASDGLIVLIAAHLYKAAQHYGLLSKTWIDMDFFISQHGGKQPFFTKTPASADGFALLRHYLIDLGVEVVAFSQGKMPSVPSMEAIPKGAKKVTGRSGAFRKAMHEQYAQDNKLGISGRDTTDIVLTALTRETSSKGKEDQHFTPIELLSTLKLHLAREELLLNFDYFPFYKLCMDILLKACFASLPEMSERTAQPHRVVDELLRTAAHAEHASKPVSGTPLAQAAALLDSVIGEQGQKFSTAAHHRSSGHEPKHMRPEFGPAPADVTADIAAILKDHPGASVGTSQKTIEIYDPRGSYEAYGRLIQDRRLKKIIPGGPSLNNQMLCPADELDSSLSEVKNTMLPGQKKLILYG